MDIKSTEAYRADARRLRKLAEVVTTPALRKTLLDAAVDYERLANRAEKLADHGDVLPG